jgi:hypothetical protein
MKLYAWLIGTHKPTPIDEIVTGLSTLVAHRPVGVASRQSIDPAYPNTSGGR